MNTSSPSLCSFLLFAFSLSLLLVLFPCLGVDVYLIHSINIYWTSNICQALDALNIQWLLRLHLCPHSPFLLWSKANLSTYAPIPCRILENFVPLLSPALSVPVSVPDYSYKHINMYKPSWKLSLHRVHIFLSFFFILSF